MIALRFAADICTKCAPLLHAAKKVSSLFWPETRRSRRGLTILLTVVLHCRNSRAVLRHVLDYSFRVHRPYPSFDLEAIHRKYRRPALRLLLDLPRDRASSSVWNAVAALSAAECVMTLEITLGNWRPRRHPPGAVQRYQSRPRRSKITAQLAPHWFTDRRCRVLEQRSRFEDY